MMDYNPFSLEGKTILITGGAGGIGSEVARVCSKLGARIILTDIREEALTMALDMRGRSISPLRLILPMRMN